MNLGSLLYNVGRIATKSGSIINDANNIANGHPEKVIKKAVNREVHKNLNRILRGMW